MVIPKHHLLIFDSHLCKDDNFYPMISKSLSDALHLSSHYGKTGPFSLSICSLSFETGDYEINPVLSPIVVATSTIPEILASVDLLHPKKQHSSLKETEQYEITIDWDSFTLALAPQIHFPAQEGYRISVISMRNLVFDRWIQQPDCLSFQVVKVENMGSVLNIEAPSFDGPMTVHKKHQGFEVISVPGLLSEWDTFFKKCVLDPFLSPEIPIIIHFSTSIYSKLIICCQAKPRSLNMNGYNGAMGIFGPNSEEKIVLETVARLKQRGICQSLIGSQPLIVVAREVSSSYVTRSDDIENVHRFKTALRTMHEDKSALLIRTVSTARDKAPPTMKRLFIMIPSYEEGYFLMTQITPSELIIPEMETTKEEESFDEDDIDLAIQMEVNSALKKIPCHDYYDPFEFPCGIIKALESQTSREKRGGRQSTGTRTVASRGGKAGRGRGRPKSETTKRYTPIAKTSKN